MWRIRRVLRLEGKVHKRFGCLWGKSSPVLAHGVSLHPEGAQPPLEVIVVEKAGSQVTQGEGLIDRR